jgi:hypothetical protein
MKSALVSLVLALSLPATAATLPGFKAERLGATAGFVSSIAVDSRDNIYYTTTSGSLLRFEKGESTLIATVDTDPLGNSGLLGMALVDDDTAVVHYTLPRQTYDVVSWIDLRTGEEGVIHRFPGDVELPERGVSSEHHGGNPTVAPDGSIFVGIGDYGMSGLAKEPGWNAGKIFRIGTDNRVTTFATGFRNPFDSVWDPKLRRLIVADNGPLAGDEIHVIEEGAHCGWPYTYGFELPHIGSVDPDYVFERTIAPTGMTLVNDANRGIRGGVLMGAYVTRSLYYFADLGSRPVTPPIVILDRETPAIIDVTQAANGEIYFATGNAIYRLATPARGDCDGDGLTTSLDIPALENELNDGSFEQAILAQNGDYRGSWGCDADGDGFIHVSDRAELLRILSPRRRATRAGQ